MLSNNLSKTYLCGGYLRLSKEDVNRFAKSETLSTVLKIRKNILKIICKANRKLGL